MTRRTIRTAATSSLALAVALAAAPAAAQSFQGTPTVTFGSATVTEGTGTTDVAVNSSSAVIDWTPDDTATGTSAPILFQPTGTTATYAGAADFAVLNRIVPTDISRAIVFDGTVLSRVAGLSGGTVFFYSPGGVIIGANAFFDVGNLGLTTAEPVVDGNGNWYTGNQVQFQQAASSSLISILPGSQITASAEGSYVAAFAPYVYQGGRIDVNGQAALVAAEAGTITFSPDGLFDIQVSVGTDGQGGTGILHEGTTTGPASSGLGDNHRIYMVAIPKNQALQLAITRGSEIGFDIAGAADVQGNFVVLSAGRNVQQGFSNSVPVGGALGNISINDSSTGSTAPGIEFTSGVRAGASGEAKLDVFNQTNFASDLQLSANQRAFAAVGNAGGTPGTLTVGGNLSLTNPGREGHEAILLVTDGASASVSGSVLVASGAFFDDNSDGVVTGGDATVLVDGGTLDIGGSLTVDATGDPIGTSSLDVAGGSAQIFVQGGGSVDVGGVTRVVAEGLAGLINTTDLGAGGDGTGGLARLTIDGGSTMATDALNITADGVGGEDVGAGGGTGTGGAAEISVSGANSSLSVVNANSFVSGVFGSQDLLSAEGFGGRTALAGGTGGNGVGGDANIFASAGAQVTLPSTSGSILVRARGNGGNVTSNSGTGGDAFGGDINIVLDGATMSGENLQLSSFAPGGGDVNGSATGVVNGGNGVGGTRSITLVNGSTFTGSSPGGGPGGSGGDGSATGTGGDGSGGQASLTVDGSTLNVTANGFSVFAQTNGGSGGTGGSGTGGTAFGQVINGGVVNLAPGARILIGAGATSDPTQVPASSVGGNATGGAATLLVENGTIAGAGIVEVNAFAFGASVSEGQAGNGTGGTAHLQLRGATINVSDIVVNASGTGGSADPFLFTPPPASPGAGNGGNGTGGFALITADTGVNTLTATLLDVDADGSGGSASGASGNGGIGTGGQSRLAVETGASLTVNGSVAISADGEGGTAGTFDSLTGAFTGIGTGGNGIGGNAQMAAIGGALTVSGDAEIEGVGEGGMGITGGNGTAGSFIVNANGGSIAVAGNLDIEAEASGGEGTTNGGDASGSFNSLTSVNAFLQAENGGSVNVGGATSLITEIQGGSGGNGGGGGSASGGATLLLAKSNASSSAPSTITLNDLFAVASATGGDGGSVASGSGSTGGAGGSANAGTLTLLGDAGSGQLVVNGLLTAVTTGQGGLGGSGDIGGAGGTGSGGFIQIGTRSGAATPGNTGSATFADVSVVADGLGGDGGQGFAGAGGDGGLGFGGGGSLLVRGSPVTANSVVLQGIGVGGDGGVGSTDGAGGFGVGGALRLLVSQRFERTERGSADIANLTILSAGIGGSGSTPGISYYAESGGLSVTQSDVNLGTFNYTTSGDQAPDYQSIGFVIDPDTGQQVPMTFTNEFVPIELTLSDATVTAGSISMSTPGEFVLNLDSSTLDVGTLAISAGTFVLPETAPVTPGTIDVTGSLDLMVGPGGSIVTFANFVTASSVNFTSDGDFQTGDLTADGDIIMTTVGNLVTGNLASTGQILLTTNGNQTVGNVTSGGATNFNVDGVLIAGQVQTGGSFFTLVDGNQTIGNVIAGDSVDIRGGADISVGSIMGAASVYVISAGGVVTTGAIDAGDPALTDGKRFGIALRGSSLTTGNLATQGPIIAAAESGTMTLGNVSSGSSILLLGAGNIATGSVAGGTDPGETFYVGGVDNLARLGAGDDFQPIIAVDPSPTGGSVTLGGPVSADRVLVAAGGTAAINGMVTAPFVQFVSGDIAIGTSGGINTGTGQVRLVSSNASGMFVGDGGSGGYTLDNAEFSRVRGSEIFIAGVDGSTPIDMTIGNLSISGSQTGPNGTVVFATGDLATMTSSGGIRVNGEVVATNQTANNYLEFYAALIEVNAQIGGIRSYSGTAPTGTGNPGVNALGGIVVLEANNVHVASDTILQKLRADPFYSGHAAELNQPGAINRPNGALTALGIEFYPGETLYVQNTGTADNPAGFYATLENSDIDPFVYEGNGTATPQVEVVINGSFASPNGDVSGQPAYQLIIDNAESLDGFSGASQVNGCSFDTGACGPVVVVPEEEAPPTNNAEIQALTEDQSEEEPFDTEEDEDEAEQAASSPIAPPVVLINTSPLNPDVDVTDPVSGTGNPALIGASISQPSQGDQQ